jgi:hypothetical protein
MFLKKALESYANLYFPFNKISKKEKFDETSSEYIIGLLVYWLVNLFAIYLSFRCNKGFNFGSFLLAFFFGPFYIIYHLAVTNLCGLV